MIDSNFNKLMDMLKRHEGLRLTAYLCPTGHKTIGYGHNLEAHGQLDIESIDQSQADEYLMEDVENAIDDLEANLAVIYDSLDTVRKFALVDLAFNMGVGSLMKFHNMMAALAKSDYSTASNELLNSKYARQVGDRAIEIATMILNGTWQ